MPHDYANFIPTDIRGLTFARTPQQVLNIIFLGNQEAKGTFFPNGVLGRLDKPAGFDALATGLENFPIWPKKAPQVCWCPMLIVVIVCVVLWLSAYFVRRLTLSAFQEPSAGFSGVSTV